MARQRFIDELSVGREQARPLSRMLTYYIRSKKEVSCSVKRAGV